MCDFLKILSYLLVIPLPEPVQDTCWPSDSVCGNTDRSSFGRCVDGRDPKFHEVWIWGDDRITPKVHTTARVDVDPWITLDFATDYFSETRSRTAIFVQKSINWSFEFLDLADSLSTCGIYWIKNIVCPSPSWVVRDTLEHFNWGGQPGGCYGGVDVLWRESAPVCLAYLPRRPENVRVTARRVRDDLIREHRLERPKSPRFLANSPWSAGQSDRLHLGLSLG